MRFFLWFNCLLTTTRCILIIEFIDKLHQINVSSYEAIVEVADLVRPAWLQYNFFMKVILLSFNYNYFVFYKLITTKNLTDTWLNNSYICYYHWLLSSFRVSYCIRWISKKELDLRQKNAKWDCFSWIKPFPNLLGSFLNLSHLGSATSLLLKFCYRNGTHSLCTSASDMSSKFHKV